MVVIIDVLYLFVAVRATNQQPLKQVLGHLTDVFEVIRDSTLLIWTGHSLMGPLRRIHAQFTTTDETGTTLLSPPQVIIAEEASHDGAEIFWNHRVIDYHFRPNWKL